MPLFPVLHKHTPTSTVKMLTFFVNGGISLSMIGLITTVAYYLLQRPRVVGVTDLVMDDGGPAAMKTALKYLYGGIIYLVEIFLICDVVAANTETVRNMKMSRAVQAEKRMIEATDGRDVVTPEMCRMAALILEREEREGK